MIRPGIVSNYLHDSVQEGDVVQISVPFGDFTIDETSDAPIVLITGGVGITPALSMAHHHAAQLNPRPMVFVHTAPNSANHAFREEIEMLAEKSPHLKRSCSTTSRSKMTSRECISTTAGS